jgi:bifunctional ADP-heptose synthase (sugar kinase/adenylyltransferase)
MLINNYLTPKDDKVRAWVKTFKEKCSLTETIGWIDKLKEIEVNIMGETIIDVYTNCKPLSKSSKDPILAFHKFETEKFLGGVLAIAESCSRWSKKTYVYSSCGEDIQELLNEIDVKIEFEHFHIRLSKDPTILKHRFVDVASGNRVFEYYDFNPEMMQEKLQNDMLDILEEKLKESNLFLLADYGHGFFGESMIKSMCDSNAFLAVNTQSNAGNRGFNTFSKYPRIDFLCLNGGELELEFRKKDLDYHLVLPRIMKEKGCKNAVVTLGGEGLLIFDRSGEFFLSPALATKVVDKVGAGDSVLAIASMLAFLDAPKEVIGLLASVVAAFEVSQLGHKKSLDIVSMKKYISSLLN